MKLFRNLFKPKAERTKVPKTVRNQPTQEPQDNTQPTNNYLNMDPLRKFKILECNETTPGVYRTKLYASCQGNFYWPIEKITQAAQLYFPAGQRPEWDMSVATNDGTAYRVRELIYRVNAESCTHAQEILDNIAAHLIANEVAV